MRRFSFIDIALALIIGFIAGINEPPWPWYIWAIMGGYILVLVTVLVPND